MVASTTIRYAKSGLANALLVTISILVTYAVAELIFFRLVLPYMSLNLLPHLPDRAAFFLQSSKTEYVPRDYIALIGDSNAQGMGDWLLKTAGDLAKPHHSADVLHQVLGWPQVRGVAEPGARRSRAERGNLKTPEVTQLNYRPT